MKIHIQYKQLQNYVILLAQPIIIILNEKIALTFRTSRKVFNGISFNFYTLGTICTYIDFAFLVSVFDEISQPEHISYKTCSDKQPSYF